MVWKMVVVAAAFVTVVPGHALAEKIVPPPVPVNLAVPSGYRAFAIARAEGTQNYLCVASGAGSAWAFLGPQATLFGERGEQVMTHYLSPNPAESGTARATWRHSRDSSAVWALAIASSTDADYVEAGAIPWLLLRVVGFEYGPGWGDRLTTTAYIQRVNTTGGVPPSSGCGSPTEIGNRAFVPYTTEYIFYRGVRS